MKHKKNGTRNSLARLVAVAIFWCTPAWAEPKKVLGADFNYEISRDGSAIFFTRTGSRQTTLWRVECERPLRNCIALTPGLVLRVVRDDLLQFATSVQGDSRVSIQEKNYTRDVTGSFFAPMRHEAISHLSGSKSFIVIERDGHLLFRQSTAHLDRVADYLIWINGLDVKAEQDARLWPDKNALKVEATNDGGLERYEMMGIAPSNQPRQMVPNSKPQSEFAIRSQGGTSYFSETGRSGY